jgi:hypothetical protein
VARVALFMSASLLIVIGLTFLVLAGSVFSLYPLNCWITPERCEDTQGLIVEGVFFARVPADVVAWFFRFIPLALLVASGLSLYTAWQQLRYVFYRHSGAVIGFSLGSQWLLIGIILLIAWGANRSLIRWADELATFMVVVDADGQAGTPETATRSLAEVHQFQLKQYRQIFSDLQLGSVLLAGIFLLLSLGGATYSHDPPLDMEKRYLEERGQCKQCGLVGNPGQVPECMICRSGIRLNTELPQKTIGKQDDILRLTVKIAPEAQSLKTGLLAIRNPILEITYPAAFHAEVKEYPDDWTPVSFVIGTQLRFDGPTYLQGDHEWTIDLHLAAAIDQQRRPIMNYPIQIRVYANNQKLITAEDSIIRVQRDKRWHEKWPDLRLSSFQRKDTGNQAPGLDIFPS